MANEKLRDYVQERLAGQVRRPGGEAVPGPAVKAWKGRNRPRREDRRWARAWSPEQISARLRLDFPDDESMRISHEAIYQSLYVQGRGALRRELTSCLRTGRALRVPRARARRRGKGFVTEEVMISRRPAEAADRAVPGHWEGDLILGVGSSATGTLVERTSRFAMLLHLPPPDGPRREGGSAPSGHGAEGGPRCDRRASWPAGAADQRRRRAEQEDKPTDAARVDGKPVGKQFRRTPFAAVFQAAWFKYEICAVHIYYGGESGKKLAERVGEIGRVAEFFGERAKKALADDRSLILLGDFNIVGRDHETMKALEAERFHVPEALREAPPTNVGKDKYYDQIAFRAVPGVLDSLEQAGVGRGRQRRLGRPLRAALHRGPVRRLRGTGEAIAERQAAPQRRLAARLLPRLAHLPALRPRAALGAAAGQRLGQLPGVGGVGRAAQGGRAAGPRRRRRPRARVRAGPPGRSGTASSRPGRASSPRR